MGLFKRVVVIACLITSIRLYADDPPSCYIVSNAENSSYNGTYLLLNRTCDNRPLYAMAVGSDSIFLGNKGCTTKWALALNDITYECPTYTIDSDGDLPPSSGYYQGSIGANPGGVTPSNLVITNGDGSLPVELSAFSACEENGVVVISWTTQSEIDHLGFILQRAIKADEDANWQTVASYKTNSHLKASGDSRNAKTYELRDKTVENETVYYYRLKSVNIDGSVEYSYAISVETSVAAPVEFALHHAFPNPFNPETTLTFDLARACNVSLIVSDITGKQIRALLYNYMSEGNHTVKWDGLDHQGNRAVSGVYFITLETNMGHRFTEKVLMLK